MPASLGRWEGLGRNGPPALAEVRAGPAEVQGDPDKPKEACDGPRDPQGRPAGDRGQVTGVCPGCSRDPLGNCWEPLQRSVCAVCHDNTLSPLGEL